MGSISTVFHEVTIGQRRFAGILSADGPYLLDRTTTYGHGVALGVSKIADLDPRRDWMADEAGWFVVKYEMEARISLKGMSIEDLLTLARAFGLSIAGYGEKDEVRGFYASPAWRGLKAWVAAHPRAAKRYGQCHNYLYFWYERAMHENAESNGGCKGCKWDEIVAEVRRNEIHAVEALP
jgi:hypothetical protein